MTLSRDPHGKRGVGGTRRGALEPIYVTLGANICAARRVAQMTQLRLSQTMKPPMDKSLICYIEQGKSRTPVHVVIEIARVLGVPWIKLLREHTALANPAHR